MAWNVAWAETEATSEAAKASENIMLSDKHGGGYRTWGES